MTFLMQMASDIRIIPGIFQVVRPSSLKIKNEIVTMIIIFFFSIVVLQTIKRKLNFQYNVEL